MVMARARLMRERAGLVQASIGSYRAAENPRSRSPFTFFGGSGDNHADHRTRRIIREMTRHLERNSHTWGILHDRWLDDLGTPQPRFMSEDVDWNKRMADRWHRKAMLLRGGWDSRNMTNWGGWCRLFFGSVGRDGDAAVVKVANGTLSLIESDCIDSPARGNQYQQTVAGVTLDREGAIQKTWICPRVNGYPQLANAVPYSADQVVFCAHRKRQSQTRGMPPLVAGIDDFERGDSLLESTVIQAEQSANIYGAIKRIKSELARAGGTAALAPVTGNGLAAPIDAGASNTDQTPDYVSAARGALLMLYEDQEFAQIKNENPNLNVPPFMQFLLRLHALGLSYPYEIAFMDMNGNSWSNGKMLVTLARHGMSRWRDQTFNPALTDIAQWQVERWIREEETGATRPAGWDLIEWDWPELPWPDPLKEEQTNKLARENGSISTRRITRDWQRVQDEIIEEDRRRDQLQIQRIAEVQRQCNALNGGIDGLKLHWSHVVTLVGATSAPGAYLQAAAAKDTNSGGETKVSDEAGTDPKQPA